MSEKKNLKSQLPNMLLVMRIILLFLFLGVGIFAAWAMVAGPVDPPPPGQTAPLGMTLLLVSTGPILMRFLIPNLVARQMCRSLATQAGKGGLSEAQLVGVFQSRLIVSAALLEGAAFLNWMGFYMNGFLPNAVLGVLTALGILVDFPTAGRVQGFVEVQQRRLKEDKLFS